MAQSVECVYNEPQQPRIEPNTRVLLERIQLLEDRLFASPVFSSPSAPPTVHASPWFAQQASGADPGFRPTPIPASDSPGALSSLGRAPPTPDAAFDLQIALSHTANANHVYEWPIVRELLARNAAGSAAGARNHLEGRLISSSKRRRPRPRCRRLGILACISPRCRSF